MRVWRDPAGVSHVVLAVFGAQEMGDYDCAAFVATPALIERLVILHDAARQAQAVSPDLFSGVIYRDYTLAYYNWNYDSDQAEGDEHPPEWIRVEGQHRTEGDELVIDHRGGVVWQAYAKHTDTRIVTEEISVDQLRQVLAGEGA